eukprot:GHVR01045358.1.p1 GENE.GHVR01045358.1~~GHVR01045358.1.p1  ORF type:complete len:109 (+),score=19.21 GHVR01045358.1:1012-1338(+)
MPQPWGVLVEAIVAEDVELPTHKTGMMLRNDGRRKCCERHQLDVTQKLNRAHTMQQCQKNCFVRCLLLHLVYQQKEFPWVHGNFRIEKARLVAQDHRDQATIKTFSAR